MMIYQKKPDFWEAKTKIEQNAEKLFINVLYYELSSSIDLFKEISL